MKFKQRAQLGIAVLGLLTVFLACSRGKDYLYIYQPAPPKQVALSQQIKGILHPQVDILWVMGNMPEHATQLALGVSSYMADFVARTKVEWKMALIADDPDTIPYLGLDSVFDYRNVDPVGTFVNAVGVCQVENQSTEQMFHPVLNALTRYPNFRRPNATFGIVFVNDCHESCGQGSILNIGTPLDGGQFLSQVAPLSGGLDNVFTYGVFGATDLGCDPGDDDEDWNYQGSTFNQAISAQHGFSFSLCSDDFGTSLSKITDDLVTHVLHPQIILAARPDPKTIQVLYNGSPLTPGLKGTGFWVYNADANAINFTDLSFANEDTAAVQVTFTRLDS
jgi:hypothetical protein